MAVEVFANLASTTLGGSGITSTSTGSCGVVSSAGFSTLISGQQQFRALIVEPDGLTNREIVIVTAISGTTWTIIRGAEGTTAATHTSAAVVTQVATRDSLIPIPQTNWLCAAPGYGRNSQAALARSRDGGAPFRLHVYGDSTVNSQDSTTAQVQAWTERFRQLLASRLSSIDSVGEGLIWLGSQDTRISPASWVGPGGAVYMFAGGTGVGTLSVTLPSCDTVKVYFPKFGGGTASANLDGGTGVTIDCSGTTGIAAPITVTGSVGTHTLNIVPTSGQSAVYAIEYYTSGSPTTVRVSRCGANGTKTSDWIANSNAISSLQCVNGVVVPDLAAIQLGTNDLASSVSVATYLANYQTLITQLKTTATDVVLIAPYYSTVFAAGTLATGYLNALVSLAELNGCAIADFNGRWQTEALAAAAGYLNLGDTTHESNAGNWDLAEMFYSGLAALGVVS